MSYMTREMVDAAGTISESAMAFNQPPPSNGDKESRATGFDSEEWWREIYKGALEAARLFSGQLDPDDLAQDTAITLLPKIMAGLDVQNPVGIGFNTARWLALNQVQRSPERKIPHIPVEEAWHLRDERANAETHVIVQEHIEVAMEVLKTPYQRECWWRNVILKEGYQAISEATGKHPEAVHTQCRRSKAAVAKAIKEFGKIE